MEWLFKLVILFFIIILILNFIIENFFNQIYIIKRFYSNKEIENILNEVKNFELRNIKNEKSYKMINKESKIYDIIYSDKLKKLIKIKFNKEIAIPKHLIEYRIYENSDGMDWHRDKSLFKENYLECILLLKNNSNSYFKFKKNNKKYRYYQKKGDLILLYPLDIEHKIDPIFNGKKHILKFIINFI